MLHSRSRSGGSGLPAPEIQISLFSDAFGRDVTTRKAYAIKSRTPFRPAEIAHMSNPSALQGILKWPLIVAAVVVISRVLVERAGAPGVVSNMLSVAALHTLIVPLYLAGRIGRSNDPRPYFTLIKLIAIYAICTRAMVLPTYWAARIFNWPEPRFAGLAGPDVTPFVGFIAVPFLTAAF